MKTSISKIVARLAIVVAMGLAGSGIANAQACIDNPAEIQALINEGRIISQYDAIAAEGYSSDQILNFRLCESGGGYVWIVGILSADGTAQNLTISAQ
jgi:hypothetical protein